MKNIYYDEYSKLSSHNEIVENNLKEKYPNYPNYQQKNIIHFFHHSDIAPIKCLSTALPPYSPKIFVMQYKECFYISTTTAPIEATRPTFSSWTRISENLFSELLQAEAYNNAPE